VKIAVEDILKFQSVNNSEKIQLEKDSFLDETKDEKTVLFHIFI